MLVVFLMPTFAELGLRNVNDGFTAQSSELLHMCGTNKNIVVDVKQIIYRKKCFETRIYFC